MYGGQSLLYSSLLSVEHISNRGSLHSFFIGLVPLKNEKLFVSEGIQEYN